MSEFLHRIIAIIAAFLIGLRPEVGIIIIAAFLIGLRPEVGIIAAFLIGLRPTHF